MIQYRFNYDLLNGVSFVFNNSTINGYINLVKRSVDIMLNKYNITRLYYYKRDIYRAHTSGFCDPS